MEVEGGKEEGRGGGEGREGERRRRDKIRKTEGFEQDER